MKKFLLLLAITATMSSNGQLKNTDSTTVSNAALKRILTAAEQKKILDEQVILLTQRISGYEATVKELNNKDTATVGTYERQIKVMKDQRKIYEGEIKRIKRKLFWRTAAGIGMTSGLAILYFTK